MSFLKSSEEIPNETASQNSPTYRTTI